MKTIALTMLAAAIAASFALAAPAATNDVPKKAAPAASAATNAVPKKAAPAAPAATNAAPKKAESAFPAVPPPPKSGTTSRYGGSSSWDRSLALDDEEYLYERWIKGRLSIGVTYSSFKLENKKRPANREEDFLGNINELSDHHNERYAPVLEYRPIDYINLGVSYMNIEAGTMNFNNGEGDGTAVLKGPTFSAELALPLIKGIIVPHAGIGYAKLKGDFKEDTWWGLGYSSPTAWEYYGKPADKSGSDHYRYIDVEDASETYFTFGVSIIPHPHVKLDVSYHKVEFDPSCEFGYDYAPRGGAKAPRNHGDFDMSGEFWLFSASYIF